MGELQGRHLLTIEGLSAASPDGLTPVMKAFLEENASQCGFCSPGFIVSLTGWLLEAQPLDLAGAIVAVEGNLCRCTGYGAIARAAARLAAEFAGLPAPGEARIAALVAAGVVPASVEGFRAAGASSGAISAAAAVGPAETAPAIQSQALLLGGGTDWYVRNPEPEDSGECRLLDMDGALCRIETEKNSGGSGAISVGAAVTVREFFESPLLRSGIPGIEVFGRDVASSLIRNRATIGGNVANASPVADMTAILIGLGARVRLGKYSPRPGLVSEAREMPLERLFRGYKSLDLSEGEIIESFEIRPCAAEEKFNFEKIAKRRTLDIAAVNTAMRIRTSEGFIAEARISAGGVAPVPLFLERSSAWLAGKPVSAETAREAARLAMDECCPIGDVRGSAEYRRRLLGRLVIAHFIRFFPDSGIAQELLP
jgi:xanthine dehydrogenase small subunit